MLSLLKEIEAVPALTRFGRVARIEGLGVEITGAQGAVQLGGQVRPSARPPRPRHQIPGNPAHDFA